MSLTETLHRIRIDPMDRLLAVSATTLPTAGTLYSVLSQTEIILRILGLLVGIAGGLYSIYLMHKRQRPTKVGE
jgi:hypothetical protein